MGGGRTRWPGAPGVRPVTDQPDVTPIPKPEPRVKEPSQWGRKRKRIKTRSDRKADADATKGPVREAVFVRDGRRCRIAPFLPDTKCFGPPTVHHLLKESQGGAYEEENLITACAWHNDWVEDHPTEATALGLVRRPWHD